MIATDLFAGRVPTNLLDIQLKIIKIKRIIEIKVSVPITTHDQRMKF